MNRLEILSRIFQPIWAEDARDFSIETWLVVTLTVLSHWASLPEQEKNF